MFLESLKRFLSFVFVALALIQVLQGSPLFGQPVTIALLLIALWLMFLAWRRQ